MNEPTLRQLHEQYDGKVSDKGLSYLAEYDRVFADFRTKPIRLLAIGVHNGGSLEIWSRYFAVATAIVGCAITADCVKLRYADSRVSLVLADANTAETEARLVACGAPFDVIVDNGSHTSDAIVRTFARYFRHLAQGGVFVVEDLYSTYRQADGSGLFQSTSADAFFKCLVDVVAHAQPGMPMLRNDILSTFDRAHGFQLDNEVLLTVHSVEFVNSCCIVRKQQVKANLVEPRLVAGLRDPAVDSFLGLNGSPYLPYEDLSRRAPPPMPGNEARVTHAAAAQQSDALAEFVAERQRRIEVDAQLVQQQAREIAALRLRADADACRLAALQTGLLSSEAHAGRLAKQVHWAQAQLEAAPHRTEAAVTLERDRWLIAERNAALCQQQLDAILQSKSWQLTASLRWIGHKARLARRAIQLVPAAFLKGGGVANTSRRAVAILRESGLAGVRRSAGVLEQAQAAQQAAAQSKNGASAVPDSLSAEPVAASLAEAADYVEWVRRYDTVDDALRHRLRRRADAMVHRPLISIVMPTYNPRREWLLAAVDSVLAQIYSNWELCIADDASTDPAARRLLQEQIARDSRIKVVFREENGHISAASNSALAIATGEWIALMDHDDLLSEHALLWVAEAICDHPDARLIYSDEDKIDANGQRFDPFFKSDWNIDLFYSQNFFSHLGVYEAELMRVVEGFREGLEGSQDYDLVLRCLEHIAPRQVHHIPRVLYHWRVHADSTASSAEAKPYAVQAGVRALVQHFEREGIAGNIECVSTGYRVQYALASPLPLVSLIIPTRNAADLVRQCVNSILALTTYNHYEIIIVDNGSDDEEALAYFRALAALPGFKVLRDDNEFNYSALNNLGVKHAGGQVIGLINNDIEVIAPDWLSEMTSLVMQPGVGAVGARLWYPDKTLQHGGVVLGMGGVAGHAHKNLPKGLGGYFGRASLVQSFSAVTGACLLVLKENYEAVNGLNEVDLKVAFNDVDFCLRLREIGLRNLWTPYAELIHHESATRGEDASPEKRARFVSEVRYMEHRWGEFLSTDPAYNPNLNLERDDFSLAWPPRVVNPRDI